jgi:hypothetical protein
METTLALEPAGWVQGPLRLLVDACVSAGLESSCPAGFLRLTSAGGRQVRSGKVVAAGW